MTTSTIFQQLKSSRGVTENVNTLLTQIERSETKSFVDEREWKLTVDPNGNGSAIIRFLPGPADEKFEKLYNHAFKHPISGKWFIEKCPTTIGLPCPVCDSNTVLWNTGVPQNQETVRSRKRHLKYISNIYIITDVKNKDAEGKVMLFRYGPKIFEKIKLAAKPVFPGIKPCNVFDLWDGANFQLLSTTVQKQRNYDSSVFEARSQLVADDDVLEKIWNAQFSLAEFIDPTSYKTFDELEKRFKDFNKITTEDDSTVREHIQQSVPIESLNTTVSKEAKYQNFLSSFPKVSDVSDNDDMPF